MSLWSDEDYEILKNLPGYKEEERVEIDLEFSLQAKDLGIPISDFLSFMKRATLSLKEGFLSFQDYERKMKNG